MVHRCIQDSNTYGGDEAVRETALCGLTRTQTRTLTLTLTLTLNHTLTLTKPQRLNQLRETDVRWRFGPVPQPDGLHLH